MTPVDFTDMRRQLIELLQNTQVQIEAMIQFVETVNEMVSDGGRNSRRGYQNPHGADEI